MIKIRKNAKILIVGITILALTLIMIAGSHLDTNNINNNSSVNNSTNNTNNTTLDNTTYSNEDNSINTAKKTQNTQSPEESDNVEEKVTNNIVEYGSQEKFKNNEIIYSQ